MIRFRELCGGGEIPHDRTSASLWLRANGIEVEVDLRDGSKPEHVHLSDMHEDICGAYLDRQIERAGLEPGVYDEAAHDAFRALPASILIVDECQGMRASVLTMSREL